MRHAASFSPDGDVIRPLQPLCPKSLRKLSPQQVRKPLLPSVYPAALVFSSLILGLRFAAAAKHGALKRHVGIDGVLQWRDAEPRRSRGRGWIFAAAVKRCPPRNPAAGDILLACSRRHPTFRVLSLWPRWRRPALLQPRVRARPSGGCSTSDAEHGGQAQSHNRNNE